MKIKHFLILVITMLSTGVLAQNVAMAPPPPSQYSFDTYPVFPKNDGDVGTYIVKHIKKPQTILGNLKQTIAVSLQIDDAGKATLGSMYPSRYPDINEAFNSIIPDLPNWRPATLNGKPVNSNCQLMFFVEMNKDRSTMYVERFPHIRQPKTTGDLIFNGVEVDPKFPGGEKEFDLYLLDHTKYPEAASARHISGRVYVQMTIEKDGSLTDLFVMRDPGFGLGDEALRLLCVGPKWIPGVQNGKTVRVRYTVPIKFFLAK